MGERVSPSGGQKQGVTLARTFLKNPRILILDDATSSVDTETEAAIRDALLQLMPGRTTIMVAHRVQTLSLGRIRYWCWTRDGWLNMVRPRSYWPNLAHCEWLEHLHRRIEGRGGGRGRGCAHVNRTEC